MARTKLLTPNFNLSKRGDGYYQIRYRENDATKTVSTGTKDPKEAEVFRARLATEYQKPKIGPDPSMDDVFDAYIKHRKPLIASPETLDYVFAAPKRIIGHIKAESFTQSNVAEYVKLRMKDPAGGRFAKTQDRVSDATINKELRMVRAALNWSFAEKLIQSEIKFRIELTNGKVRDKWITKEEANRLMDASSPHMALFILLALSTAKRREAILSLTWDQVDLSRPGHEIIHFGEDVGNKKRGSTPISGNKRLINALIKAKETATTDFVIEWRGKRMLDVKTALAASSRRAGLERVSSHVLKHSAVTWMVQAGVSFERISKFTNTSKEIIQRVYGHHSPEFVADATEALAF